MSDNFNYILPMSGYLVVYITEVVDKNQGLATVMSISNDENDIKVNDQILLLLDDNVIGFKFNLKRFHRIQKSSIVGKFTKILGFNNFNSIR